MTRSGCSVPNDGLKGDANWSSIFGDPTTILFYVDPDHRDDNEHVGETIKNSQILPEKLRSYVVINYAATWLPNVFIQNAIESKQRQFTHATFVKDLSKTLIKCWSLADDSSDVLLIGRDGLLKFYHAGPLAPAKVEELLGLIRKDVNQTNSGD